VLDVHTLSQESRVISTPLRKFHCYARPLDRHTKYRQLVTISCQFSVTSHLSNSVRIVEPELIGLAFSYRKPIELTF
jgi:hypothetical protein